MAGDSRNLMLGAASLGKTAGGGLAQSVRAAMWKARLVALLAEPIAEPGRNEWLPELSRQECEVIARRLGDRCRKRRVNRD